MLKDLRVPLSKLLLDPNNYRLDNEREVVELPDSDIRAAQAETLEKMELERLGELRDSIEKNGFLEMDRIVVRPLESETDPGFFVVVEGNRRTAALKGLVDEHRSGTKELDPELLAKTSAINVLVLDGDKGEVEEMASTLMGIRHVSGPKGWTGYQSARLIDDLRKENKTFSEICALLGMRLDEAHRKLNAYYAFKQMEQDDQYGDLADKNKHFNLFSELLARRKSGADWLGCDRHTNKCSNTKNLKRVYEAITSTEGSPAEINNPDQARVFLKFLADPDLRHRIEQGEKVYDWPDPKATKASRIREISRFKNRLAQKDWDDLSEDEFEGLNRIFRSISDITKNDQIELFRNYLEEIDTKDLDQDRLEALSDIRDLIEQLLKGVS